MAEQTVIRLRRRETSTPWGFRMQGGREFGNFLYIQKVNSKSVAAKCGLLPGDGILMIGNTSANYLSHEQAKMEIIRAGNELDLIVQRNAMDVGQDEVDTASSSGTRSQVSEESSEYRGYTNPSVQSRSFKILQASLNYSEASGASACQPVESYLFRYQDMYAPLIDKYREAEEDERDRKTTMLQNTIRQERGRSRQTRDVTRQDGGSDRLDAPGHPENRTEMIPYIVDMERNNVEDKLNMLRKISKNNSRSFSPEKPRTISPEKTQSLRQDVADNGPTQFNQDVLQTERMGVEDDGYVSLDVRTLCLPETPLRDDKNVMVDNRSAQVHQTVTQLQEVVNGSYMKQEFGPAVRAPTAKGSCFEADLAQTQVKAFQAPTRPDAFRPSPVQPAARQVEGQQSQAGEAEQVASMDVNVEAMATKKAAEIIESAKCTIRTETKRTEKTQTEPLNPQASGSVNEMFKMDSTDAEVGLEFVTNSRERINTKPEAEQGQVEANETRVGVLNKSVNPETYIIESERMSSISETETAKSAAEGAKSKNEETKFDDKTVCLETCAAKSETWAVQDETETANSVTWAVQDENETANSVTWAVQGENETANSVTWLVQDETEAANSATWAVQDETETANSVTWAVQGETEAANSVTWVVQDETETFKVDTENKLIIDAGKSEIEREINDTVTEGKHTTSKYEADGVTEVLEKVEIKTKIAVVDEGGIERSKILTRKTEIVREFSYDEDDESYDTWTEEESDTDADADSFIEETVPKEFQTTGEAKLKMETS